MPRSTESIVTPLHLSRYTATTCLGRGLAAMLAALENNRSALKPCQFETVVLQTWIGEIAGLDDIRLPASLAAYDCRNNRLAALALETDEFGDVVRAAIGRYGANRIGLILGSSTSGILQTELAYRRRDPETGALPSDFHYRETHNMFSVAAFARDYLGLAGPASVISTACSSSAKTFAAAARMIEAGLVDAAVVGGVDSLCLTTLYGFNSLELISQEPCRPFDPERAGISVAEGAAFALLERPGCSRDASDILLLGTGESSDAYHMSSPHPQGLGAQRAMEAALAQMNRNGEVLDYINLHGTATRSNDSAEAKALAGIALQQVPCSSTKGATGHTLGAAGAIEAVICALAIAHGLVPGSAQTRTLDPQLELNYVLKPFRAPVMRALSNSFGFGGSNCSLLFGRAQ